LKREAKFWIAPGVNPENARGVRISARSADGAERREVSEWRESGK
jgi:hypothetical protein